MRVWYKTLQIPQNGDVSCNQPGWESALPGLPVPPGDGRAGDRRPASRRHAYDYAVCDWRARSLVRLELRLGQRSQTGYISVRRSVPTARHASSVEGERRARPLHGHGASRADHPRRTVQLGAAISALEWVAHVTHSPRFDERLMLLRLASSNTCPAKFSCSMHAARSEWVTSIRPVTGLCPRELAGAVDHVPCEHQLCAAACQTVQRTVLWCYAHRGRRTRSRDLSCAGGVVQAMNSTSCTSGR